MKTNPPVHASADGLALRATRRFWLILVAGLLSFAAYFSYEAPTGLWRNKVFGTDLWFENDPGGDYVASAHELFLSEQGPLFPGHPGLTLQFLLCALQHAYSWLAGDDRFSFTEFTARHVHSVFFLSKMLVTVVHALGAYFVYRLARALEQPEAAAVAAALAYATCLPFLYYLSRISVEPLMVLFFVTTFLSLLACHRRLEDGDSRGALVSAGLAGALAVSGSFTKLNLLGPLPFFGLAYLLARGGFAAAPRVPISRRLPCLLAFAATALLVGVLYSGVMDWGDFQALWRKTSGLKRFSLEWSIMSFVPAATADGVFLLSELTFLSLATAGWVRLLRRPSSVRPDLAWLSLYSCWVLTLWLYRASTLRNLRPFHYLFLVMVLMAVSFGFVTRSMLARVRWSPRSQWLALIAWVGVVHLGAIWSVVDSRSRDVAEYRPLREIHEVLGDLEPGQRIGLLDRGGASLNRRVRQLHGLSAAHARRGRESLLETELQGLFEYATPSEVVEGTPIHRSSLLGAFAVIGSGGAGSDGR